MVLVQTFTAHAWKLRQLATSNILKLVFTKLHNTNHRCALEMRVQIANVAKNDRTAMACAERILDSLIDLLDR
jgi:hypothetical protein